MATQIIEYYSVVDHGCDGREFPGRVTASFTKESDANEVMVKGWDSIVKTSVVIHDSVEDYNHHKSGKAKADALAKLTAEERKLLGV